MKTNSSSNVHAPSSVWPSVVYRKLVLTTTLTVACLCCGEWTQAQFGGVQVRVGGYGSGVRGGGFSYGTGLNNGYGNSYGYGSNYGNSYGYGNNYGNNYGNGFQSGYGSFVQPRGVYYGTGLNNGYGYQGYPGVNYSYGTARYYNSNNSMRRYGPRRFR